MERKDSGKVKQFTEEDHVVESVIVENSVKGLRYQRLNSSSKIISMKDLALTNLFCMSIDGSNHSEVAVNIVTTEFLKEKSKILLVHIFNEKLDDSLNYKYKKDTVLNFYSNKINSLGDQADFLIRNRDENISHALEQVKGIASYFKSNYLVSGYYGIKGPKEDNNELSKGVSYLLGNSLIPTIIIKDTVLRKEKTTKGYTWLVVLDKQIKNSIKCFYAFSELVDPENDFVHLLVLNSGNSSSTSDEFKEQFMREIETRKIKKFEYECDTSFNKKPSEVISEKINFGNTIIDFLVFYNSRDKHKNDGNNSDVINVVKNSSCSICFYNF